MSARALARSYGIGIRFADLGSWGSVELRSEYDPAVPEIRINRRIAERLGGHALRELVAIAIGHELYHHREQIGEIATIAGRVARELAADRFARALARKSHPR
jgi:hypothetical protein